MHLIGPLELIKGHLTYPPLNLIPDTLWIPEMKRAGKISRTAKFDVCSIGSSVGNVKRICMGKLLGSEPCSPAAFSHTNSLTRISASQVRTTQLIRTGFYIKPGESILFSHKC